MTFSEYIELYGFKFSDASVPEIKEVRAEASEHIYRTYENDLVSRKRPVESEQVKNWRRANKRFINHEIIDTALSECRTNIYQVGFNLLKGSDTLKTWIEEKRFKYLLTDVNLWEFYLNCILPEAIGDPNGYLFILPIDPRYPNVYLESGTEFAPANMPAFEQVGVEFIQVPSDKIKSTMDSNVFVIEGGHVMFEKRKLPWYWTGDSDEIYKAIPDRWEDNKLIYRYELWYRHELGRAPVVIYPGRLSKSITGLPYQESLFKPAFAYLNEFVNSFSDDQWMRLKNNYATLVLPAVSCSTCSGEQFIVKANGDREQCHSCGGTGKMKAPGLSEFLVLPSAEGLDGKTEPRQPYYLSPDIGSLTHSWETSFDLLDKAAASLGVNPLIKSSESGEAMKMRMEKLNKTINMVYQASLRFIGDVLEIVEGYLVVRANERVIPVLKQEFTITVRDLNYLKQMYQESLPIERTAAVMDYLSIKYQNDPVELKKYSVLSRYYPETLLSLQEAKEQVAFGAVSEENYNRAKMALTYIDEVIEEQPDFVELPKNRIYQLVEEKINVNNNRILRIV